MWLHAMIDACVIEVIWDNHTALTTCTQVAPGAETSTGIALFGVGGGVTAHVTVWLNTAFANKVVAQKRLRNRRAAAVFRLFGHNLNLGGAGLGCHPAPPAASPHPPGATQFLGASVSAGFRFRGLTIRLLPY